jgi:hypothetical protein
MRPKKEQKSQGLRICSVLVRLTDVYMGQLVKGSRGYPYGSLPSHAAEQTPNKPKLGQARKLFVVAAAEAVVLTH